MAGVGVSELRGSRGESHNEKIERRRPTRLQKIHARVCRSVKKWPVGEINPFLRIREERCAAGTRPRGFISPARPVYGKIKKISGHLK